MQFVAETNVYMERHYYLRQ